VIESGGGRGARNKNKPEINIGRDNRDIKGGTTEEAVMTEGVRMGVGTCRAE
jgi:hypothetical protein